MLQAKKMNVGGSWNLKLIEDKIREKIHERVGGTNLFEVCEQRAKRNILVRGHTESASSVPMWFPSHVIPSPCDSLPMWFSSHVVLSPCGSLPIWFSSHVVLFPCGSLPVWFSSHVVVFPCGSFPITWLVLSIYFSPDKLCPRSGVALHTSPIIQWLACFPKTSLATRRPTFWGGKRCARP